MIKLLILLRTYWFAVTVFLLAVITFLSLTPMPQLPPVPGNDKIHHFIAYSVLMFSVALRRSKYWPAIGLFLIVWSGGIELVQPYVNRHSDWMDLLTNCAGIVIGAVIALIINYTFLRSEKLK
ncbi:VanZ family protein [Psychromonas sp. PT13]|uniref:VanZ family protein n=1 Tax=Psychromonas sp. PT13 TaxID=3439547 RepID=UPI003EB7C3C6